MVNRCPTRLPRVCAHCGGNHRVFARTRRIGHDIPQNTAHGFTALSTKICSRCNTRIHRDWHNPCDQCPPQSSAVRLSNSLIIAADAARQQMQSTLQTLPATLPTTAPVTSSIILPASVVSTIITPFEKVAFSILAGHSYTQHKEYGMMTGTSVSRSTWYYHQPAVLNAIKTTESKAEETVVTDIKSRERWVAVADGGWSQRRNASHHSFIIMDAQSNKIVHAEIIDKELKKNLIQKKII